MRVLCLPADDTGCGHFRMIWVARELAAQGHDVQLMMPEQRNLKIVTDGEHVAEVHLTRDDADVIVLQRVTHPLVAAAIPVIRANGVAVVVDVDDDLSTVHPRNPAYAAMHPAGISGRAPEQKRHSWHHLAAACRDATLVTVSTPALLDTYTPHGRGVVLPNVLPEVYFATPHTDSALIGWPASIQTHPDDPTVTGGAIARLVSEGARFTVMADPTTTGAAFGLPADPPGRPGITLDQWPAAVAELGIGVAPLTDTRFNAAKCVDSSMRISTNRGLIEARYIRIGDRVWRDGWRNVEAIQHDVPCPGFEFTMEGGYRLRLTPDHRMLVNGEWTCAKDIVTGDHMALEPEPTGPTQPVRAPWPAEGRISRREDADHYAFLTAPDGPKVDVTPRWGRFLGAFVGDGSCGQGSNVVISCDGQDQDWIDLLTDDLTAMGLTPTTETKTTFDGVPLRRRSVRFASSHAMRVLKSFGLAKDRPSGNPLRTPCVPEVIWQSPRDVVAEFLAGYFEADGNCTSTGVQATSKDEQLIRDVQRLLLAFGIVSRVHSKNHRAQNGFEGLYWHVSLNRDAADVFAKEIGFRSGRKRARLEQITSKPHSNAFRPMRWDPQVVEVRPCMVSPVDIQVEGSEYIAAGFVSHNSWLKPLEMAALGVPVVMSPRPEYQRLHALGVGVLAGRPRAWYRELRRLVDSEAARLELSQQGRAAVDDLRVTTQAWRWMEAWQQAARIQQGVARPVAAVG